MRSSLLFVVALAVTSPLAANWVPVWTPTDLHLVVGQAATVKVHIVFSGLIPDLGPIDESFSSDDERVAVASVHIVDEDTHYVQITAMGPGTAAIRAGLSPSGTLGNWPWVRITVDCGTEAPIRPFSAVLRGSIGQPVAITVVSTIPEQTLFAWYLGRTGDRSHPLDASGPTIAFTPAAYGTQYLWVSATSACSSSSTEFRVDTPFVRRRAASK